MSRSQKLLERFKNVPADLTWEELVSLLRSLGYEKISPGKTSGSRQKFINEKKEILSLHKPHPGNIVKKYVIEQILESLKERGLEL